MVNDQSSSVLAIHDDEVGDKVSQIQRKRISVFELDCIPLWGVVSVCGRRQEMEDAVEVVPHFMKVPIEMFVGDRVINGVSNLVTHFFGVYDGHGGSEVAKYCRTRLHIALEDELKAHQRGYFKDTIQEWEKLFTRCFQLVDFEVSGSITPLIAPTVGSTAVVGLICSSHIIVANCGDSRAVLYRGKDAVPLSNDHKPSCEDETKRIKAAGGTIIQYYGERVCGVLSMTRSIGDGCLKPFIIPDPEVTFTARTKEDKCLILASDGLWDVMSSDEACENAYKRILIWHKKNGGKGGSTEPNNGVDLAAQAAADYLVKMALQKGTQDNISVIVVDLKTRKL